MWRPEVVHVRTLHRIQSLLTGEQFVCHIDELQLFSAVEAGVLRQWRETWRRRLLESAYEESTPVSVRFVLAGVEEGSLPAVMRALRRIEHDFGAIARDSGVAAVLNPVIVWSGLKPPETNKLTFGVETNKQTSAPCVGTPCLVGLNELAKRIASAVFAPLIAPVDWLDIGLPLPSPRLLIVGDVPSAVLRESHAPFRDFIKVVDVRVNTMFGKYLGETEKNLTNLFADCSRVAAREPLVLILRDIHHCAMRRSATSESYRTRALTTLLLCLDGFEKTHCKMGILALSALPAAELDAAFIRPGRFDDIELIEG
ncbi:MAG: uncharacterized protein KVP18_003731 [Porospora cf. gigantea A]|uniref:uncharacterized protein n=1 Tax=Porospora cf. gigantea A TaxID=2853593 RepID=UPI00355AB221|nr:MAG: hypothetical protein KVP18_003731 [Porospora cf. gigantea A]